MERYQTKTQIMLDVLLKEVHQDFSFIQDSQELAILERKKQLIEELIAIEAKSYITQPIQLNSYFVINDLLVSDETVQSKKLEVEEAQEGELVNEK